MLQRPRKYASKRRWLASGLLSGFLISFITSSIPVQAYDPIFYQQNNIIMYEPGLESAVCRGDTLRVSGSTNAEKIYNYLVTQGLESDQAIGVLVNVRHESGYSPTRVEEELPPNVSEGNQGYGIVQWTNDRRHAVQAHLSDNVTGYDTYGDNPYEWGGSTTRDEGYVPKDRSGDLMDIEMNDDILGASLDFLYDETQDRRITQKTINQMKDGTVLSTGDNEWQALLKATTAADAARIFLYNFEVPDDIAEAEERRVNEIEAMRAELTGVSSGAVSANRNCRTGSADPGSVAALQEAVATYAWNDFMGYGYMTPKPEYAELVRQNQSKGMFVGGMNGIDCGGFVTQMMIVSGFEPNYNYGGTLGAAGATDGQHRWLKENWELIGTQPNIDTADLQPGDVAIQTGHTFMFAGTDIPGFGDNSPSFQGVASASLPIRGAPGRAPMAAEESLTHGYGATLHWYRIKDRVADV